MEPDIESFVLPPDDDIPNSRLPLLFYRRALAPELQGASACIALFSGHGWPGNWVNGIFDYWHFHVTGHEVLGCVAGWAEVGFGGDAGIQVEFRAGDVVVIPAGVGHKRLGAKHSGFTVVGGYPLGQSGAITRPGDMSMADAERAIAALELPRSDPILGGAGALLTHWS